MDIKIDVLPVQDSHSGYCWYKDSKGNKTTIHMITEPSEAKIVIHNTANTARGAGASSHNRYLKNNPSVTVLYQYIIDDKQIIQNTDDPMKSCWHANGGSRGSFGIEICENSDGDLLVATNKAVALCCYLITEVMKRPLSDAKDIIMQHNVFKTSKNCPNRLRGGDPYTWEEFIRRVETNNPN